MSTNFGVLIGSMLSAALLAGCALEVSDQVEGQDERDLGVAQEELRVGRPVPLPLPNPCTFTSCPAGTTCEVQEGEAVCVERGGLLP